MSKIEKSKENIFKFKKFNVVQDKAAMKIGTDGVLLGAWADTKKAQTILDIGSGTGVISLQIAQRYPNAKINAIDIDKDAYEESMINFANSPWSDRLTAYHQSIADHIEEYDSCYDFIISNPPFFNNSYKPKEDKRTKARHIESLSHEVLMKSIGKLLTKEGQAAIIIPYDLEKEIVKLGKENQLFPNRITHVKGTSVSKIKRSLIQFSRYNNNDAKINALNIEIERHRYTSDYITLVKDFYLKM